MSADSVTRDWLVTFAHKVAVERDYSRRHPGHVYLVMLCEDEAEGVLSQLMALVVGDECACVVRDDDASLAHVRPCPESLCERRDHQHPEPMEGKSP